MTYAEIHDQRVRYRLAGQILYEFGGGDKEELRSEARKRRKWVHRVSELRTGGKLSIGRSFLLLLLFSILYYFLDPGPVQMASAQVLPPPDRSQVEVEFPRAPDPPKGYCTVPIGSGTFEFVRVHTWHDCSMLPLLSLVRLMQPRRSAPKERDNVTVARYSGRVTAIPYSRLATSLRSLAIILPIHLHLLSLVSTFATVFL